MTMDNSRTVVHKGFDNLDLVYLCKSKLFGIFKKRILDNSYNNNIINAFGFNSLRWFCKNNSDLELFKIVFQRFKRVFDLYNLASLKSEVEIPIFILCCSGGNVEILKYVQSEYGHYDKKSYFTYRALEYAFTNMYQHLDNGTITNSYLEMLDYLKENHSNLMTIKNFQVYNVVEQIKRNPVLLDWLIENYPTNLGISKMYMENSIKLGDLPRLEKYYQKFKTQISEWTFNFLDLAEGLDGDRLDIVQFLVKHKIGLLVPSLVKSGVKGNLKIFEYLLDKFYLEAGEKFLPSLLDSTPSIIFLLFQDKYKSYRSQLKGVDNNLNHCYHNDVKLLKFFHENSIINFSTFSMDRAAQLGYIEIIKFLHQNRTEGPSLSGINKAIESSHLEVVQFLFENYKSIFPTKTNVTNLSIKTIEYLRRNNITIGQIGTTYQVNLSYHDIQLGFQNNWFSLNRFAIGPNFEYGNLKLVKLLETRNDFEFRWEYFTNVAKNGRIPLVKYIVENYIMKNYNYSSQHWDLLLCSVYSNGNFELTKYLLKIPQIWKSISVSTILPLFLKLLVENSDIEMIQYIHLLGNLDMSGLGFIYHINPSLEMFKLLVEEFQLDPHTHFHMKKVISKSIRGKNISMIKYLLETSNFWIHLNGKNAIIYNIITEANHEIRVLIINSIKDDKDLLRAAYKSISKYSPENIKLLFPMFTESPLQECGKRSQVDKIIIGNNNKFKFT
eukprot:gene10940-13399_t